MKYLNKQIGIANTIANRLKQKFNTSDVRRLKNSSTYASKIVIDENKNLLAVPTVNETYWEYNGEGIPLVYKGNNFLKYAEDFTSTYTYTYFVIRDVTTGYTYRLDCRVYSPTSGISLISRAYDSYNDVHCITDLSKVAFISYQSTTQSGSGIGTRFTDIVIYLRFDESIFADIIKSSTITMSDGGTAWYKEDSTGVKEIYYRRRFTSTLSLTNNTPVMVADVAWDPSITFTSTPRFYTSLELPYGSTGSSYTEANVARYWAVLGARSSGSTTRTPTYSVVSYTSSSGNWSSSEWYVNYYIVGK